MAASSADDDAFDRRLADQAGLMFAPVNAELELEEPFVAFGIDVIRNRRSASRNRFLQHLGDRLVEPSQLIARERSRATTRPHSCAEQRLVGVDIADAAQQLLVEQRALDRRLTFAEQVGEQLETNVQR